LAAIPLAFILPAVCYLKLEDGSVFSGKKIGSLGLAVFGIGATVIGIVSLIVQVNKNLKFKEFSV
jgi:sodium-coupled neutral amino acid transporter 11